MKRKLEKIKAAVMLVMLYVYTNFIYPVQVYAGTIAGSKMVTGTSALINDVVNALLIIIPVATVVLVIYRLFKLENAEDESDEKPIKRKIKSTIVIGVACFLVDTLFKIILGYYK